MNDDARVDQMVTAALDRIHAAGVDPVAVVRELACRQIADILRPFPKREQLRILVSLVTATSAAGGDRLDP